MGMPMSHRKGQEVSGPAADSAPPPPEHSAGPPAPSGVVQVPREIGGRDGPDPTRFGDWEKNGRCIDF
jgi:hypothetical protein